MKKFLISILVILLMVLAYFLILKDVTIGSWKNSNIDDIKNLNTRLDEEIGIAKQLNDQEYPTSIEKLESAIKELKITKEKYQSKMQYVSDNVELGTMQIKEYKIERLWIALEKYAKEEGIELKLDLLDTATENVYDMNITLTGGYIGITDFLYDIEKDDTLGFKIQNFKLLPNSTAQNSTAQNTEETTKANGGNVQEGNDIKREDAPDISKYTDGSSNSTAVDTNKLRATFKIEGVGIELN